MSSSHSDIAHKWAHQVRNRRGELEAHGGNMLYMDDKIYSYGRHFVIARLLSSGVVVYGLHKYSSSTAKHQSIVRSAVSHKTFVYCHDPDDSAAGNRRATEQSIEDSIEMAAKPRIREDTRLGHLAHAVHLAKQFNEYLAALPEDERGKVQPLEVPELTPEQLERRKALAREKEQRTKAAQAERERREMQDAAAKIELWRKYEFHGSFWHLSKAFLRLSRDRTNIETSKGADIPVTHAKRLWPIVQNCKAVGEGLTGRDIRLGHYVLSEIKPDGSIVVGCHDISWEELELMAKELGLLEEMA